MKAFLSLSLFALSLLAGCGAPMQTHPDPAHDMATPGISDPPPPTPDKDGSRIRQLKRRTTTADGYQGTEAGYSLFDGELATECVPLNDSSGQVRCFPSPYYESALGFADANCTIPAVFVVPSCSSAPVKYIAAQQKGFCFGPTTRYKSWKLGAQVNTYFTGSPGACTQSIPPAGYTVLTASEAIPDASLAAITYRVY